MQAKSYFFLLPILIILLPCSIQAQNNVAAGLLPSINLNKKLPRDWTLNFKAESRQLMYAGDYEPQYILTDLSLMGGKKIGINTTLTAGYLQRLREDQNISRAIQQLSTVRRYAKFKLAHRIRSDQTFRERATEYRLRYRASAEIPLNGYSLDAKEMFLKLGHEYLNSLELDEYDLEVRGSVFLGYFLSPGSKVEFGTDYRLANFLNDLPRHQFWLSLNYYRSF